MTEPLALAFGWLVAKSVVLLVVVVWAGVSLLEAR